MTQGNRRAASAAPQRAENGSWFFRVDVPGTDGRRHQTTRRGFPTRKAAQEALDGLRVSVTDAMYTAPRKMTVREYLMDVWLPKREHDLKRATVESYARTLRLHVVPHIGRLQLTELEPAHLDRLYATLRRDGGRADGQAGGLSPRSVRYVHAIVRAAIRDAVKSRILKWDPTTAATPGRATADQARREIATWTPEELSAFLAAERGGRYWALWTFLATTGCRRGEALGLRWADVADDYSSLVVRQTYVLAGHEPVFDTPKTHKPRVIELDTRTSAVLRQLRAAQAQERLVMGAGWRDHDLVFCLPDGRPYHPDRVSREFDRRVARHGLPRVRLHDLRHGWATMALAAGTDIKIVSERLGHSTTSFTRDVYQHVSPVMQQAAAERVAALVDF